MQSVQNLVQGGTGVEQETPTDEYLQKYPPEIVKWEMAHHIVREERNGMIYIRCTDFDAFNKQIEDEKAKFRLQNLRRKIAEAQDAAYLGEQTTMSI